MRWSLWLDNVRDSPDPGVWETARTVEQAKLMIKQFGMPVQMSLDHDLGYTWGDGSMIDLSEMVMKGQIPGDPDDIRDAPDGLDFVAWLVVGVKGGMLALPPDFTYYVHSSNAIGSAQMQLAMKELTGKEPTGTYKWWILKEPPDLEARGNLTYVRMEWGSGLIQELYDEDAQKWLEFVNAPMILHQARNPGSVPDPKLDWYYTRKS